MRGGSFGAICVAVGLVAAACVPPIPPLIEAPLRGLQPAELTGTTLPTFVMAGTRPAQVVVVAVHGLKGSAGVFAQPASRWAPRGIVTYAVTVTYPGAAIDDIARLVRGVAAKHPATPLFVIGESLGASLVLTAFSHPEAPAIDGLVLAGPAIWPDRASAASARRGLGLIGWVTRKEAAFWAEVVALMDAARDHAARVRVRPVMVLSGDRDEVVPRQGVAALMRQLGPGAELRNYRDGGHTLFRNAGGDAIADQLADWMLDRAASKAATTAVSASLPAAPDPDHASAN
jgi:acylglycerol lipase